MFNGFGIPLGVKKLIKFIISIFVKYFRSIFTPFLSLYQDSVASRTFGAKMKKYRKKEYQFGKSRATRKEIFKQTNYV